MDRIALILAAGIGSRMASSISKVLHEIDGKTFIENVLDQLALANISKIIVVVGYKKSK